MGRRGYNAHAHDASMSLFVFDSTSEKFLICGYGTPCYSAGEERNLARNAAQYPTVSNGFKRRISGVGSFRIGSIFKPRMNKIGKSKFQDQRSTLTYEFFDSYVKIGSDYNKSKFHFYSDIDGLEKVNNKNSISFRGHSIVNKRKTLRYDGIYNAIDSFHYEISFDSDLVILLANG